MSILTQCCMKKATKKIMFTICILCESQTLMRALIKILLQNKRCVPQCIQRSSRNKNQASEIAHSSQLHFQECKFFEGVGLKPMHVN